MFDNIRKKINSKLYNFERNSYIKMVIKEVGQIVEEEDRIMVYANQKLVDKRTKKVLYDMFLIGMDSYASKLVCEYNLDKPVYYIFDGINFDCFVKLDSQSCNVIFKNCTFVNGLSVLACDNLTLENNKYYNWTDFYSTGKPFLNGKIGHLTIKNDDFINSDNNKAFGETKFGISVSAINADIINSNICADGRGCIDIKADKISITNSKITAPEIYLDVNNITSANSVLSASDGIIIDDKKYDFNANIQAPTIVYNGVFINSVKDNISVNKEYVECMKARQALVSSLKNIGESCQQINERKASEIIKQLDSCSLKKVLKK